ncbi:hypothetical protein FT641_23970 [Bacillus paranthracis]|nr:hypothetical protein CK938_14520 [Bacillus cereus]MBE7117778.1 hypothetical protein [Bacillus paranthracis]MBE7135198.1 hypothetical protein [Bacillus paranthracis]MBE7155744.1 hypothetical protein [Bacillus paranthracis]MBL3757578.1 hypothetical protein [Bacillus cereus]
MARQRSADRDKAFQIY